MDVETRFWNKVDKRSHADCWGWLAGTDVAGYGVFRLKKGNNVWKAHRFSWTLYNGEIPEGMWICHHCDNPPCVNPEHLFLGTALDNSRDMIAKGRCNSSGPPRQRNGRACLTEKGVKEIRRKYSSGNTSQRRLAKEYGVGRSTIGHVVNNNTWKEII